MKKLRLLLVVFCLLAKVQLVAQEPDSTDQALLEDLGADLLGPSNEGKPTVLDERLLDQLGEDIGEAKPLKDDWLSRVIRHMKDAEGLLEEPSEVSRASESQSDALTNLDTMIAELTQRKNQCQGGEVQRNLVEPKPGEKPKPSGKAGKSPAPSGSNSTNADADLSTELAANEELVKDLWGKLPERQRQQILQPLSEEFLPKYASEIEAYFRALAQPKSTPVESR